MNEIDPFAADFKPLSELLNRLPRRPSPPVVCRWCLRGVGGVKLRTLKIAGRRFTTETEFRRFLRAIGGDRPEPTSEEHAAIERQLAEAGYR